MRAMVLTLRSRKAFDCEPLCLYLYSFLSVLSFAVVIFAVIYRVEYIVNGTLDFKASHKTVFIIATASFVNSACRIVFSKFMSRLSDYVGRKPLLFMATFSALIRTFIIYEATTAGEIYFAAFLYGTFDVSLPIAQAWICDVVTNPSRGAALGMNAGVGFGMAFAIGIPIGSALPATQGSNGIKTCFYLSFIISIIACIYIVVLPISDTLGVVTKEEEEEERAALARERGGGHDANDGVVVMKESNDIEQAGDAIPTAIITTTKSRRLPSDCGVFLINNQPFSSFHLIMQARDNKWDFVSYFWAQAAQQVLQVNFLLFLSAAYGLGPAESGGILAFIGIAVAFWSPLLLSKYKDRGISMVCMALALVSYMWLAVTGLPRGLIGGSGQYQAYPIYLMLSISGTWISGLPSIITKQYPVEQQGEALGVLTAVSELSHIPAYGVGILFSFLISPASTFYWPGAIWLCTAFFFVIALSVQYLTSPQGGGHLFTLLANDGNDKSGGNDDDDDDGKEREKSGSTRDSRLELRSVYSVSSDTDRNSSGVRYSDTRNPLSMSETG